MIKEIIITTAIALSSNLSYTERLHPVIAMHPDQSGNFMRYQPYGAKPWRNTDPVTGVWAVSQAIDVNSTPEIVKYDGLYFRSPTGARKGIPWRWADLIIVEPTEVPPPGPIETVPPITEYPADGVHLDAVAGQQLIDILKRSFTVNEINRMMEASPYDEPDQGAPEPLP